MLIRDGSKTDRRKPVRLQVGLGSVASVTLAATAAFASAPIATTTTTTTAAAGTGRAFFTRTRDVDGQRPALKFLAVEHFDGLVRFFRS